MPRDFLMRIVGWAFGALSFLGLSVGCGGTTDLDSQAQARGSISQTCARISGCMQELSRAECEQNFVSDRTRAVERGCGALHDAILSCDERYPGVCTPEGRYEISTECVPAVDAIEDCRRGGDEPPQACSGGGGGCANPPCPNTCFIECGDFAAECSGWPGQLMSCSCTMGPQAGRPFSATDCAFLNQAATAELCR